MKTIPKGYHNCHLSIVNCQFKNAPFLHFYFLNKIKTLPVAAAYLSARGSDGPLERDRKNHYQTALSTLLERRHLVQAYTWQGVPLTTALTRFTLGFQARLERLWEWETLIPKVTPLPQKSHFAIHCTSHPDNSLSSCVSFERLDIIAKIEEKSKSFFHFFLFIFRLIFFCTLV